MGIKHSSSNHSRCRPWLTLLKLCSFKKLFFEDLSRVTCKSTPAFKQFLFSSSLKEHIVKAVLWGEWWPSADVQDLFLFFMYRQCFYSFPCEQVVSSGDSLALSVHTAGTVLCNIWFGRAPTPSCRHATWTPPSASGSPIASPAPQAPPSVNRERSPFSWRWHVKRHFAPYAGSLKWVLCASGPRTNKRKRFGPTSVFYQLVWTLFTLDCFRFSIAHIPARVSGQRGRWRTRSGLQAAVICLTSD